MVEKLLAALIVLGFDDGHSGREIPRVDDVHSHSQVSPGKLCSLLQSEGDGSGLGGVVVELSSLRGKRDSGHGSDGDDVTRFGCSSDEFGGAEEREEGKGGEMVGSGVDLVSVQPGSSHEE
jgi:hypothetical protein